MILCEIFSLIIFSFSRHGACSQIQSIQNGKVVQWLESLPLDRPSRVRISACRASPQCSLRGGKSYCNTVQYKVLKVLRLEKENVETDPNNIHLYTYFNRKISQFLKAKFLPLQAGEGEGRRVFRRGQEQGQV